jgi:hypothetical protein
MRHEALIFKHVIHGLRRTFLEMTYDSSGQSLNRAEPVQALMRVAFHDVLFRAHLPHVHTPGTRIVQSSLARLLEMAVYSPIENGGRGDFEWPPLRCAIMIIPDSSRGRAPRRVHSRSGVLS